MWIEHLGFETCVRTWIRFVSPSRAQTAATRGAGHSSWWSNKWLFSDKRLEPAEGRGKTETETWCWRGFRRKTSNTEPAGGFWSMFCFHWLIRFSSVFAQRSDCSWDLGPTPHPRTHPPTALSISCTPPRTSSLRLSPTTPPTLDTPPPLFYHFPPYLLHLLTHICGCVQQFPPSLSVSLVLFLQIQLFTAQTVLLFDPHHSVNRLNWVYWNHWFWFWYFLQLVSDLPPEEGGGVGAVIFLELDHGGF